MSSGPRDDTNRLVTVYIPMLAATAVSLPVLFFIIRMAATSEVVLYVDFLLFLGYVPVLLWGTLAGERRLLFWLGIIVNLALPLCIVLIGIKAGGMVGAHGMALLILFAIAWYPTIILQECTGVELRRLVTPDDQRPIPPTSSSASVMILLILGSIIFLGGNIVTESGREDATLSIVFAIPFVLCTFGLISLAKLVRKSNETPQQPIIVSPNFLSRWVGLLVGLLLISAVLALIMPKNPMKSYVTAWETRDTGGSRLPGNPVGNSRVRNPNAGREPNSSNPRQPNRNPEPGTNNPRNSNPRNNRPNSDNPSNNQPGNNPNSPRSQNPQTDPRANNPNDPQPPNADPNANPNKTGDQKTGTNNKQGDGKTPPNTNPGNGKSNPNSNPGDGKTPPNSNPGSDKSNPNKNPGNKQPNPNKNPGNKPNGGKNAGGKDANQQPKTGNNPNTGGKGGATPNSGDKTKSGTGSGKGTGTGEKPSPDGGSKVPGKASGGKGTVVVVKPPPVSFWLRLQDSVLNILLWAAYTGEKDAPPIPMTRYITQESVTAKSTMLSDAIKQNPFRLVKIVLILGLLLVGFGRFIYYLVVETRRRIRQTPSEVRTEMATFDPFADPFDAEHANQEALIRGVYITFLAHLSLQGFERQPSQTEFDFATWLEQSTPLTPKPIWTITRACTFAEYAGNELDQSELDELHTALKDVIRETRASLPEHALQERMRAYREQWAANALAVRRATEDSNIPSAA